MSKKINLVNFSNHVDQSQNAIIKQIAASERQYSDLDEDLDKRLKSVRKRISGHTCEVVKSGDLKLFVVITQDEVTNLETGQIIRHAETMEIPVEVFSGITGWFGANVQSGTSDVAETE